MFQRAIVRQPSRNLIHGITTANLGKPDFARALRQHAVYSQALKACGLEVIELKADERFPDSTFVEDTAVLSERVAVIGRAGALSRQGEEESIAALLQTFFSNVEHIRAPGTLEGGDVLRVGDRFYVGISSRTNEEGAAQLARILEPRGYTLTRVPLQRMLHLKSGLAYLENNHLLVAGELVGNPLFASFKQIAVGSDEEYAANSLWLNGRVLMPLGFARTQKAVAELGYPVLTLDVSEFRKLDGGLSCLSLRF